MRTQQLPVEYLLRASQETLESFELTRLNRAANFRKEARDVLHDWVQAEVESRLARFVLERRRAQSGNADSLPGEISSPLELDLLAGAALFDSSAAISERDSANAPAALSAAGDAVSFFADALISTPQNSRAAFPPVCRESPATSRATHAALPAALCELAAPAPFQLDLFAAPVAPGANPRAAKLPPSSVAASPSAPGFTCASQSASPFPARLVAEIPLRKSAPILSRGACSRSPLIERFRTQIRSRLAAPAIPTAALSTPVVPSPAALPRSTAASSLRPRPPIPFSVASDQLPLRCAANFRAIKLFARTPACSSAPALKLRAPVTTPASGESKSFLSFTLQLPRDEARFAFAPSQRATFSRNRFEFAAAVIRSCPHSQPLIADPAASNRNSHFHNADSVVPVTNPLAKDHAAALTNFEAGLLSLCEYPSLASGHAFLPRTSKGSCGESVANTIRLQPLTVGPTSSHTGSSESCGSFREHPEFADAIKLSHTIPYFLSIDAAAHHPAATFLADDSAATAAIFLTDDSVATAAIFLSNDSAATAAIFLPNENVATAASIASLEVTFPRIANSPVPSAKLFEPIGVFHTATKPLSQIAGTILNKKRPRHRIARNAKPFLPLAASPNRSHYQILFADRHIL